jgi:hypothetical protein
MSAKVRSKESGFHIYAVIALNMKEHGEGEWQHSLQEDERATSFVVADAATPVYHRASWLESAS